MAPSEVAQVNRTKDKVGHPRGAGPVEIVAGDGHCVAEIPRGVVGHDRIFSIW